MAVTGLGATLSQAAAKSREAAEAIEFSGKQFRKDIGWREFARAEQELSAEDRESSPDQALSPGERALSPGEQAPS